MTTCSVLNRIRKALSLTLAALVPCLLVLACSGEREEPAPSPPTPAVPPRVGAASDFYTVAPCRLLDTRTNDAPLESGRERTFPVAGKGCNVPASAVAVAGNVTVLGNQGRGVVLLRSDADKGWLELGFEPGRNRATQVLLSLSPDGSVTATAQGSTAHLLLDVSGYFLPAPATAAGPPQ